MKPLLLLGLLLVFGSMAQAELLLSPFRCPVQDAVLWVSNPSSQTQHIWFQDPGSEPFHEVHVALKPKEKIFLHLQDYYTEDSSVFAVKTFANLQMQSLCKDSDIEFKLSSQDSPWKKITVLPAAVTEFTFINTTQQKNKLTIQYSIAGQDQEVELLLNPEVKATTWKAPQPLTGEVKVRAQGRFVAFAQQDGEPRTWKEEPLKNPLVEDVRYFLFGSRNPEDKETYVVPMSSAKMISESLEQIQNPDKARLFVGRIEKSLLNTNRDLNSPTKNPWSWHVVEAQNYADFAHISCDGSPSMVQERLSEWLHNTGGTICFWNYRVLREVKPDELK